MSSPIQIGIDDANLRPVYVLWSGYSDRDTTNEDVTVNVSGSLQSNDGTMRKVYRGQFEVSPDFPAGYADVAFLRSVYEHVGSIRFTDQTGTAVSVIWVGQFTEQWVDQGAHLMRIPFEFVEAV